MKNYKRYLVVLILALGFLAYSQLSNEHEEYKNKAKSGEQAFYLDSIVPIKIDEPFKTWYLGKIAFDVPVSLTFEKIRYRFLPSGLDGKEHVEFYETLIDQINDDQAILYTNKPLDRFGYLLLDDSFNAKKINKIDINHKINQPAGLTSYFYISKSVGGMDGLKNRLIALDLIVKADSGILNFAYTEKVINPIADEDLDAFMAEKEEIFCAWVKDFLAAYQWVGINKEPEDERLATRFGSLKLSKWLDSQKLFLSSDFVLKKTNNSVNYMITSVVFSEERPNKAISSKSELKHNTYINGNIHISSGHQLFFDSLKYGYIPVSVHMWAKSPQNDVKFHSYIKGVNLFIQDSITTTTH